MPPSFRSRFLFEFEIRRFSEQATALRRKAECRVVLADEAFMDAIPREIGVRWDELGSVPIERLPDDPGPDAPAIIQFTSGSTASPKGAVLRAGPCWLRRGRSGASRERTRREPGSMRSLGWVPFFHDLGLILYVCYPVVYGAEAHILATERFARNPVEWLRLVGTSRASVSSLRRAPGEPRSRLRPISTPGWTLSSLDVAWLAAEAIDPDVVDRLLEIGRQYGLRESAVGATYGLAEAVLAVATTPGEGRGTRLRRSFGPGRRGGCPAGRRRLCERIANCGRPEPGTEIRIVSRGEDVGERQIGEVWVRGPSLMSGYLGATEQPFADGWLRTGDLGYLSEG